MYSQQNQKGFTIVEILLVIIVTILLLGVGAYTYNAVKESTDESTNSSANTKPDEKTADTQNVSFYDFPDLGVKIKLPEELRDITQRSEQITYGNDNGAGVTSGQVVWVSTEAFNKICGGDTETQVAALSKGQGDYDAAVKASEGATTTDYYPGTLLKQFNGYFVDLNSGKGNSGYSYCSDPQKAMDESVRLQTILEKAFKTAEPL